ncbi:MAG TPA: methyltransferase domain-containing protein [Nitrososphaerales archaeon]|nr:methyltransferase domain-containing protein [Nitrososphaerales archaeon]
MPFVLPPSLLETDRVAFVLAFGRLSVLEQCAVLGRTVKRAEAPNERISVLHVNFLPTESVVELSGVHKVAPLASEVDSPSGDLAGLTNLMLSHVEEKSNISLSAYGVVEDDYEDLVRSMLDSLREAGLKKVRLLRPEGNELLSDQVLSREAFDVVAFPYHAGFGLGPTVWVPDSASMRQRGTHRPVPRSDIALSPRLARTLVNLAGLGPGQTILDPFCGSGTILIEAFAKSLRCLGLDSSATRVQEARENLHWSIGGVPERGYDVRKGDARELRRLLRGTKVDAMVTEPLLLPRFDARPKTSTAQALIEESAEVYNDALASMADSITPEGRIVMVVPVVQTMDGDEVTLTLNGRKLGLRPYQPGPVGFEYPIRLSFETTRWVRRAVYVFEPRA